MVPKQRMEGKEFQVEGEAHAKFLLHEGVRTFKELEEGRGGSGARNEAGEAGIGQIVQDFGAEHVGRGI